MKGKFFSDDAHLPISIYGMDDKFVVTEELLNVKSIKNTKKEKYMFEMV